MVKMGTVWERTAEFLTDNLPAILPIALIAYFVPLSIQGNFDPVLENAGPGLIMALGGIMLLFAALSMWGSLTLIAMALGHDHDARAIGLRRLPAALLVSVLLFLAVCLLLLPPVLTVRVSGEGVGDLQLALPIAVVWALAIYCLLALVAALWLGARLILLSPLIVAEKPVFGAILRSWRLTRGVALPIVGVMILYGLVACVAVLATKLVFGSVFSLVAGGADGLSLSGILTSVMVAAVQAGFLVIGPVFTAKLYRALVADSAADRAAQS